MSNAVQAAADRHVLALATVFAAAVGRAREAVDLEALELHVSRRDQAGTLRVMDEAVDALTAALDGREAEQEKAAVGRTPSVRSVLSQAMADGAEAQDLCVLDTAAARVQRAKAAANPAGKAWQDRGEANEAVVARMVRGVNLDDNEPMDVVATLADKAHGIEVKTLIDNKASKITMSQDALANKARWKRANRATLHTVVVDDRDKFAPTLYSGARYYYRRGVGSFRLESMTPFETADELRALMERRR